jgi:hypothetical protein
MDQPCPSDHKIEPEFLGPLGDRPLAEITGTVTPGDLFPGASHFLGRRLQAKRREQWNAVRPIVANLLRPEERILYVSFATQIPPALHTVGLGYMALLYHQVLLVFSDQRVIEILLNPRASAPGTRLRSFPYRHVRGMKISFGRLALVPGLGRKQGWRLGIKGDRKLLQLLLPRLLERLLTEGSGQTERLPIWHCPKCVAAMPEKPPSCASCGALFRSPRLATLLSLAFPGAGLFYVGHPVLAAFDFLGEVLLFVVWILLMAEAPADRGLVPALLIGGLFFLITKVESIHVGNVLAARSVPDSAARRERFTKLGFGGAALSALLLVAAFPLAASARPRLEHDLDAGTDDGSWTGSRKAAEWGSYKDNAHARSRWLHAGTGASLTVFAYPQGLADDGTEFHTGYSRAMREGGLTTIADDDKVPPPFHGFRNVAESRGPSGEPVVSVTYFIYDTEGRDIHEVAIAVPRDDTEAADGLVREFLAHARWIDAVPPER